MVDTNLLKKVQLCVLLLTTTLMLSISSCKKEEMPTELPTFTQTGTNTIAFKVNGKVWVNGIHYDDGTASSSAKSHSKYYPLENKCLQVSGNYKTKEEFSGCDFEIYLFKTLDKSNSMGFSSRDSKSYGNSRSGLPGNFTLEMIKVDTINKIYSGKFSAKLFHTAADSLIITDGFFDVKGDGVKYK